MRLGMSAPRKRQHECRAFVRDALKGDRTAEQPRELLAEMQPETGAVLAAGGGRQAREGVEEFLLILAADTHAGIDDANLDRRFAARIVYLEADRAAIGELDGVVGE